MPTIGGAVLLNARRVPDREALVADDRRWTWRELDELVGRVAGGLAWAGVGHGDRVAILGTNRPEFLVTSFAVSRLGAIVVPVNARLAGPEIAHILRDAEPVVVASDPDLDERVDAAAAGVVGSALRRFSLGPGGAHADVTDPGRDVEPVVRDLAAEHDDAFIVYTSGTTGTPKGVLLDHHRAVWAAMAQVVSLGMRDGDRYLHLAPLYHSGGVVYGNATALLGGTNVLLGAFDPGGLLATIERERITTLLAYRSVLDGVEHFVLTLGESQRPTPVPTGSSSGSTANA